MNKNFRENLIFAFQVILIVVLLILF